MQHDYEEMLTNAPPSWVGVPVNLDLSARDNEENNNNNSTSGSIGMTKEELDLSWARIGGALGNLNAITTAVPPAAGTRKRVAQTNEAPQEKRSVVPFASVTGSFHTWQCHLCKADNLDALSYKCAVCGIRKETHQHATQPVQPSDNNQPHQAKQRRTSFNSSASNDGSFSLDDLVHNLEGIEVEVREGQNNQNSANHNSTNNNSVLTSESARNDTDFWYDNDLYYGSAAAGAASRDGSVVSGIYNDSASRLSTGQWSLQDLQKWTCGTCTFENEPFICACEMCGQIKPTALAATPSVVSASSTTENAKAAMDNNQMTIHAERIRKLQGERIQELSQYYQQQQEDNEDEEQDDKPAPLPTPPSSGHTRRSGKGSPTFGRRRGQVTWSRASAGDNNASGSCLMEDNSMGDFAHTATFTRDELGKVRRYDPQDSQATEATCELSQSVNFDYSSTSAFGHPAGIQEADEETELAAASRFGVF